MDRNHRLDAPNDESLRSIEQLDDRSELSASYPHARKEWEQSDVLTTADREERRTKDQLAISISVRKWFVSVGILTPMPFVLLACLLSTAFTFVTHENRGFALLPIVLGIGVWILVSYLALRRVHTILYSHALRTTPFAVTLFCLLGISTQTLFIATRPLQAGPVLITSLVMSGILVCVSIVLSGILLFIWTSPRLSANAKFGCIAALALLLTGIAFTVTVS